MSVYVSELSWSVKRVAVPPGAESLRALRKIPNSLKKKKYIYFLTSNSLLIHFLRRKKISLQDELFSSHLCLYTCNAFKQSRLLFLLQKKKNSCNKLICIEGNSGYLIPFSMNFPLVKKTPKGIKNKTKIGAVRWSLFAV